MLCCLTNHLLIAIYADVYSLAGTTPSEGGDVYILASGLG